ncbi:MAG: FAD-dependent oxidoreductase, partial [Proteobacteria bacterium]|nr:FAD-dependent oxidoreductase [Pseudomonadota bacterium]
MDRAPLGSFVSRRAGGRRIAVIGSGIAGLASAWLLSRDHEVVLFEAGDYLGGHTHTVDVQVDGRQFPVDTGFLVFNRRTYPNLCALFSLLGVESVESEMSFGVSLASPDLEWAGSDLGSLFAQRSNLMRGAFWGMLADIRRFNRETTRMALGGETPDIALGDYLALNRYG